MSNSSRDWITENDRLSLQYRTGVNEFIRLARYQPNENGQYRCPCKSCNNVTWHDIGVVRYHLMDNGFTPGYTKWYHHGERLVHTHEEDAIVTDQRGVGGLVEDAIGHFCGEKKLTREETPKSYKHEDWLKTIEALDTEYYRTKSERNRKSSKKKKIKSRQGLIPFLAHRRKKNKMEDETLASALATWKKNHQDDKGNWTTDFAKNQFEKITVQVTDIMQQAVEKGKEVSIEDAEEYAMSAVLEHSQDWDVGIGPTIPRPFLLPARAQDSSSSDSSSQMPSDPRLWELQSTVLAQQAMLEEMQRQISALTQMQRQSQTSPMQTQSSLTTLQLRTTSPPAARVDDQTLASVEFQRERPSDIGTRGGNDAQGGSGGSQGGLFER